MGALKKKNKKQKNAMKEEIKQLKKEFKQQRSVCKRLSK